MFRLPCELLAATGLVSLITETPFLSIIDKPMVVYSYDVIPYSHPLQYGQISQAPC